MNTEYLSHHGINGQKWGKQNGPPYPLDYEDHSAEEKKSNPKSIIGGSSNQSSNTSSGNKSSGNKTANIKKAFGFDLSKYQFTIGDESNPTSLNCMRHFEIFGGDVATMIEEHGAEWTIKYLQEKWGFSEADAKSVVENLDKVYEKKKLSSDSETKKSSGKSGSGSKKSSSKSDEIENSLASSVNSLFGFDLSQYGFREYGSKEGSLKNVLESFTEFATIVQDVLDEYGEDEALDYLIGECGFSQDDAKSLIEKLPTAIEVFNVSEVKHGMMFSERFHDVLIHHGIEGQKWETNGPPYPISPGDHSAAEKKAMKKDLKWIKKKESKIYRKAFKQSEKELKEYSNLLSQKYGLNKNGKLSSAYINNFNQGMAALMTEKVSNITAPSGRAVKFIAKRGGMGVYTALADQGYDMSQVKNGVWTSGRIAYRKSGVSKVDV